MIRFALLLLYSVSLTANAQTNNNAAPQQWGVFEVVLAGPSTGTPFMEVEVGATFKNGNTSIEVPGFYDGGGIPVVRSLPKGDSALKIKGSLRLPCYHVYANNARSNKLHVQQSLLIVHIIPRRRIAILPRFFHQSGFHRVHVNIAEFLVYKLITDKLNRMILLLPKLVLLVLRISLPERRTALPV